MKILVTGTAGFIGYHLAKRLLARGDEVVGLDCISDYYDVGLKYDRLGDCGIEARSLPEGGIAQSTAYPNYRFVKGRLEDPACLDALFAEGGFDAVCNLAAQAGVRHSLRAPRLYIESNVAGFLNVLEACRRRPVRHLVFASSSSVYGLNERMPFSTSHNVDHPVSLYAASKKCDELLAHTYAHLFGIPVTGLRFFTVYGPWGRPDMALFIFTKAILEGRPIDVNNNGEMKRDFTYIDDIVEGLVRVIDHPPTADPSWSGADPDPSRSRAPYRLYNIGRGAPITLLSFIEAIETFLGRKALKNLKPLPPGDVLETWADTSNLERDLGYRPHVDTKEGIVRFVEWYRSYFKV
jgi:UDP-glucuronate 4-epimerase